MSQQSTSSTIQSRIQSLVAKIESAEKAYYIDDAPLMSDAAFDAMMMDLKALEKENPDQILPYSPTQRVGGRVADGFVSVPHHKSMLSLENAYSSVDVKQFAKRCEAKLGQDLTWACEPKLDGLAISLRYQDGVLDQGLTRGDGAFGEDVTDNIKTIRSIPLRLTGKNYPRLLYVRGEVIIKRSDFKRLNQALAQKQGKTFANPRNAAAGSLRQHNSGVTAQRPLSFYAYACDAGDEKLPPSHLEQLSCLADWGLPTNPLIAKASSVERCQHYIDDLQAKRESLDYDIDGVVIKLDDTNGYDLLGQTSKFPRWAVAYKLSGDRVLAKVVSIESQVGRTGLITPVATIEPTLVAGVVIRQISCHNYAELQRKDIRVGDQVWIQRAGDVIPEIIEVDKQGRSQPLAIVEWPEFCPCCRQPLVKDSGGILLRCVAEDDCQAQLIGRLIHFASRKGLDIEGLGDRLVESLVRQKLIHSYVDLFKLDQTQLQSLPRMGEKSSKNLLAAINQVKQSTTWSRLLYALGIKEVGESTAKNLAQVFTDWRALANADESELLEVDDIGEVAAASILRYFMQPIHCQRLQALETLGFRCKLPSTSAHHQGPLSGEVIVITGQFAESRTVLSEQLQILGATMGQSVTKKTTVVLVGDAAGSKADKAKKLGITCVSETDYQGWLAEKVDQFQA